MYKLSKTVPSGKQILSNINLSFFPGAKIGILGSNGAGKSTLMRIMAGVDANYEGDSAPARWAKIGYLEQVIRLPTNISFPPFARPDNILPTGAQAR